MKTSTYLAAFALAAALGGTAGASFAAGLDETPLADRAATLGGKTFTVEHQAIDQRFVADAHVPPENPLADRAATLDGEAFTVKGAEGSRYHVARQTSAEADEVAGTPLADRAATLGGKVFTVEHGAPAFLARFQ
jgi:hypothetical protein